MAFTEPAKPGKASSNSRGGKQSKTGTLSPKQLQFCAEYLVDLNATQAAIRAGYSAKTASSIGQENLTKPEIQEEIARLSKEREKRTEITADTVLRELLKIATADIAQAFTEDGRLKPIHEIPEDVRRAIAGIEVYEEYAGRGEDREAIGQSKKVRFWDKNKALENLGKHLRLFVDVKEHSGLNGGPIVSTATTLSPEQLAQVERVRGAREKVQADQTK
ncbi:terminase small subunit [Luteolibacter luteus]|uniref:Terminase small subunit n=1 Tax=Luteolibacter luteus TaxID=2728835 RepID=A0A858RGK2_9BACT|nr:terminase small subunit [Luteolibacter luteus]QJE95977.1 terminase small subunit [Luteolibacter luteus]